MNPKSFSLFVALTWVLAIPAQAIQNPYFAEPTWRNWYEDQTAINDAAPPPTTRRDYPVDVTAAEASDGVFYKVLNQDYPGRRYSGLFLDAYETGDAWHTNMTPTMTFDGGNTIAVSYDVGNGGYPSSLRYICGKEGTPGAMVSNASYAHMGAQQAMYHAVECEQNYFSNLVFTSPRFDSGSTGISPSETYPALFFPVINGHGSSYDQMGNYAKIFYAGAYMPTNVKKSLIENGLYATAAQWAFKASLPFDVPFDHFLRHRTSYQANGFDRGGRNVPGMFGAISQLFDGFDANLQMSNMVATNKAMTVTPPVAVIRLINFENGTWNSTIANADQLKTTICAEHPASGDRSVVMTVSTDQSFDLQGLPVTFRPKVIVGNKNTQIERIDNNRWRITVPWQDGLPEGRTDILFTPNNTVTDGMPAVVTVQRPYGDDATANGFSAVRKPTGLPQETWLVPGEGRSFDIYSEDADNFPVNFFLGQGSGGYMDGNAFVFPNPSGGEEKTYRVLLYAANELTGRSVHGTKGVIHVQNTVAQPSANKVSGVAPLVVNFDASASRDRDGGSLSYTWDFDDGASASGETSTHTFTAPGVYRVALTASGTLGSHTQYLTVNVEPDPSSSGWGLALNRGWGLNADGLDSGIWSNSDAGGAGYSITDPTNDNSSGSLQVSSTELSSVEDFTLPLLIETQFKYKDVNNYLTYFDFFGHRVGLLRASSAAQEEPATLDHPRGKESSLALETDYVNAATGYVRHLGAADTESYQTWTMRMSLREDPNHPGKMVMSGTVTTLGGTYSIHQDNLEIHHNKLKIKGTNAYNQFTIYRYQVWKPDGALAQPDIRVTDADGNEVWDDYPDNAYPYSYLVKKSLDFGILETCGGTKTKTYTITNAGRGTLHLTGTPIVSHTSWLPFSVTRQPAATALEPGGSTTFDVTFAPGASSAKAEIGYIQILSDSPNQSKLRVTPRGRNAIPAAINVMGNGLNIGSGDSSPSEADHTDFGTVTAGHPVTRTFTVHNLGTQALALGTASLSGSGAFAITSQPRASISAFGSTEITVTYSPSGAGTATATLTIPSDAGSVSFSLKGSAQDDLVPSPSISGLDGNPVAAGSTATSATNGTAFPDTAAGNHSTRTFYLSNAQGSLPVEKVLIEGAAAGSFYAVDQPYANIPAGITSPFTVHFYPGSVGSCGATVRIVTGDPRIGDLTFAVSGQGIAAPIPAVTGNGTAIANGSTKPNGNDYTLFTEAASGSSSNRTFTLRNDSGLAAMSISSIKFNGAAAASFSVGTFPSTLAPGASTSFTVTYSPSAGSCYEPVQVTIATNAGDYTFTIAGTLDTWTFNRDYSSIYVYLNTAPAWGDFNNDGRLDIVSGMSLSGFSTKVYTNTGGDFNTATPISLPGHNYAAPLPFDTDGDNDVDIFLSGSSSPANISHLANNLDGTISATTTAIPVNLSIGFSNYGDMDLDGDIDIAMAGSYYDEDNTLHSNTLNLLENVTGTLTLADSITPTYGTTTFYTNKVQFADMDGDGDQDLVWGGSFYDQGESSGYRVRIYRNDDGVFDLWYSATGGSYFTINDINGDRRPDLLIGYSNTASNSSTLTLLANNTGDPSKPFIPTTTSIPTPYSEWYVTRLDNTGSLYLTALYNVSADNLTTPKETFRQYYLDGTDARLISSETLTFYKPNLAPGDFDQDGDLDFAVSGTYTLHMAVNSSAGSAAPGAPANPEVNVSGNLVVFSWEPGDANNFNVRIGTAPGLDNVAPANANLVTGRRKVAAPGHYYTNLTDNLPTARSRHILPDGDYYIAVQAIGDDLQGGAWSEEVHFTVGATAGSGGYDAWANAVSWADPETQSPAEADPDGDGVSNLLEYAMDLDPLKADGGNLNQISLSQDAGGEEWAHIVFRRNKLAGDLVWTLLQSGDLSAWDPLDIDGSSVIESLLDDDVDGDGTAELVEIKVLMDSLQTPRSTFFRLKIGRQ